MEEITQFETIKKEIVNDWNDGQTVRKCPCELDHMIEKCECGAWKSVETTCKICEMRQK